ncbi:MAG: DUF120 domain-containing protein [Candidatus Bathyarchaeota archaeon]
MKSNQWFILFKLVEGGIRTEPIFTSTTMLAKELDCAQQTVSRWLKELSDEGFIERKIVFRGENLRLTTKGVEELTKVYTTLTSILKAKKPQLIVIEGKLFTGLGEGAYYISKGGYMRQFKDRLGFDPYPGTLNLKLVKTTHLTSRKELETYPGILIEGFSNGNRTYGGLRSFRAVVNNEVKGAVVLIQRTHYDPSVLEVIAPFYLRDKLKLKDNEIVRVKISV